MSCDGNLTAPSGWLSAPDFDGDGRADDNTHCMWTLTADQTFGKLILMIHSVDVDQNTFKYCGDKDNSYLKVSFTE